MFQLFLEWKAVGSSVILDPIDFHYMATKSKIKVSWVQNKIGVWVNDDSMILVELFL